MLISLRSLFSCGKLLGVFPPAACLGGVWIGSLYLLFKEVNDALKNFYSSHLGARAKHSFLVVFVAKAVLEEPRKPKVFAGRIPRGNLRIFQAPATMFDKQGVLP